MSPDLHSIPAKVPSKGHRISRLLLWAGSTLSVLLVLLVVLFIVGIPLPGDLVRAPLEALLTKVFRVPTRIEGPLHLKTGLIARAEAGALVLIDPSRPDAPPLARATQPRVRIDIGALLGRVVVLKEITAVRAEVTVTKAADGTISWKPIFTRPKSKPPVRFAGIGQVRVASVSAIYRAEGKAKPLVFEIGDFAGALREREPATVRGTLSFSGRSLKFDATTASLAELLKKPLEAIPLTATIEASGAVVKVDGAYTLATSAFDAQARIEAGNADPLLAAFGVAARESGALDARGQVRVNGREAAIAALALKLGRTSVAGDVRLNWAATRPSITLDLKAPLVDQIPFMAAAGRAKDKAPMVAFVDAMHDFATRMDIDAKASVSEFIGMAASWRNARVDVRIHDNVLALRAGGELLGMKSKVTLDYSARDPKRILTWHLEGGRFSTEKLPGKAQPGELTGTLGGLRGELKASGTDSRELVASALLNVEARDLRFSWSRHGEPPQELHLSSARLDIASGRSAQAQMRGRLGGRPCAVKVTGSTLVSLMAGERWPVHVDGWCRGAKLAARGHVALKGADTTGAVRVDASAQPIGPFIGALGLAADAPHAFAASGELSLSDTLVHVKLERFRLGRTSGGGTVSLPRHGKTAPRLDLSFATMDIAELATLASRAKEKASVDLLAKEVLPAKLRMPDLDLQLTAGTVHYGTQVLHSMRLGAAPREGHLRDARFAFQWQGAAIAADVSADLRTARPTVETSAAAQSADIGAALAQAGHKAFALRAGKITASVRAAGVKLGELLGSATADAVIDRARFGNVQQFIPGVTGDAEFSAKLAVTEGRPVRLSAKGSAGKLPFDVTLETEPLTQLAQLENRLPGTLRAALGETRVDASGKVTLKGAGELRVTLSGERLDRLGQLAAVKLPEVGPYSASASLAIAHDSIIASDIDAKFGKSHLLGTVSVKRYGTRAAYAADLRAPVLHLEDVGLHVFLDESGGSKGGATATMAGEADDAKGIAGIEKLLRTFDAKATLGVDALYNEGKRYSSVKADATLRGGKLGVSVQNAQVTGGKAEVDVRFDASGPGTRVNLRALANGFEYGPFADALKPKSALEGTIDLSVDLALKGLNRPFLGNADGRVEIAIFPRGLNLGAADYWGTGLLHMMQTTIDTASESRLNCAVAIFDIKEGVSSSEAFFADTTRVRIIGEIQANLVTRKLSGRLSPSAKNPQLLSLSPTVGIGGTMELPQVSLTPDSLITAPLRLIFPVHAFAFDWLKASGVPADGSAGCREAFQKARSAGSKNLQAPSAPDQDPGPS